MLSRTEFRTGRIAIFRALQLGDMLCAIPALRALRKALPRARLTLIGLPWARDFVARYPEYLDDFMQFPGYPGLPEQPFDVDAFGDFLHRVNLREFDLLLQMHGSGLITNPLVSTFGARLLAGFHVPHAFRPNRPNFIRYPDNVHEQERMLQLTDGLGVPRHGEHVDFPIRRRETAEFHLLTHRHKFTPNDYVCIHPGARDPQRRWPPAQFARVADAIVERHNLRVLITGTANERSIADEVAAAMRQPAMNLAGLTSLGCLGALIKNARLLVSNDTGVSHIAAAVGTPSAIIFIASDPTRWAPTGSSLHATIEPAESRDIEKVQERIGNTLRLTQIRRAL